MDFMTEANATRDKDVDLDAYRELLSSRDLMSDVSQKIAILCFCDTGCND